MTDKRPGFGAGRCIYLGTKAGVATRIKEWADRPRASLMRPIARALVASVTPVKRLWCNAGAFPLPYVGGVSESAVSRESLAESKTCGRYPRFTLVRDALHIGKHKNFEAAE